MKRPKNLLILSLMISSIALLIILQFFWLQSSYEKAFVDFKRETSMIFRTTVVAMRDSLVMKNVEPIAIDSLPAQRPFNKRVFFRGDSIKFRAGGPDSLLQNLALSKQGSIEIIIASSGDSLYTNHTDVIRPLASRIQSIHVDRGSVRKGFIVRVVPDTLNVDSLSTQFAAALASANILVPFTIRHTRINPPEPPGPFGAFGKAEFLSHRQRGRSQADILTDTITTDAIHVNSLNLYAASMTNIRAIILAEIAPQILFTLFLTVITLAAFTVLYRNIRSQQRLMEAKNDFINNVTHELKTPVATVSVALEALKNFRAIDNPQLTQEYLDMAQRELGRLSVMTDKILKTSVFENKGVEFKPEKVDLDVTLHQVITSMKLVFEKRGAAVRYEKEGTDFSVAGGMMHLVNMITNLIDNSLKYSPQNPVILVTLHATSDTVTLSVKDEGIGIAPEYHRKIFEKFFRVPTGDVHNTKGYGLGLSYVASVVKSHGGTIKVNSEPGKGSEFVITLPKRPFLLA